MTGIGQRIGAYDWDAIRQSLDAQGWARLPALIGRGRCDGMAALYGPSNLFRSHVVMARHGFGNGEYRYFAYPLPATVRDLRAALYPRLLPVANRWHERLNIGTRFPESHDAFLARCHTAGQTRPTPLLLRYGPGDYNCLHQDLYGEHVFPLQVAILLSEPGAQFEGGEFVITEQRPRMQTRVRVVALTKGDGLVFAVNHRPHLGARGDCRVALRHGVSEVRAGQRHTLGIIFHDAA
jgi:hypothetical protein